MKGVLIFEGMRVGILAGDLTVRVSESGAVESHAVLSTAYNAIPVWLRAAVEHLKAARDASNRIQQYWSTDEPANKELLVAELLPSIQAIVACGITLDALFDLLRPHANLSREMLASWRRNRTGRAKQIVEVIRRVYRLDGDLTERFTKAVSTIILNRDQAVHPSMALRQSRDRPDLPVGVDWKFALYRYTNAETCLRMTVEMVCLVAERRSGVAELDAELDRIVSAMCELKVVSRRDGGSDKGT